MASLLDIVLIHPIQQSLLCSLSLGDLLHLSRTNSTFRAVFHGVPIKAHDRGLLASAHSRPSLFIGAHDTQYWKRCKSMTLLACSESHHVRGEKIRGCRMCSMPVCEACIIKSSFGKPDERTFSSRTRSFCPDCYGLGNVHRDRRLTGTDAKSDAPHFDPQEPICECTAKDGHLCVQCKTKQRVDAGKECNQCHGKGCSRAKEGGFSGRVCLWCDLRLPGERDRAVARRNYDSKHLLARSHSTYERPPDDEMMHPTEQVALWESSQTTKYKPRPQHLDPFEQQMRQELSNVSTLRSLTAEAVEEERWRRSESFRRSETFSLPPPARKQTTTMTAPAIESTSWRDTDSFALTLVERDDWDIPIPPEYSSDGECPAPALKQRTPWGKP